MRRRATSLKFAERNSKKLNEMKERHGYQSEYINPKCRYKE